MFIFNDKFKKLITTQVTTVKEDLEEYTKLSEIEYEVIKLYLDPYPKTVLELGCGLGRMSIFLNKKHPGNTKYYLADRSEFTKQKEMYGWNPKTWYNDLTQTKEFCELNDLTNFELIDLSMDGLERLKDIDLVFSVMSVGFHYPIEDYLGILKKIISKDGLMMFGVRSGVYEKSSMLNTFKVVNFHDIPSNKKEKLLVLKGWN